MSDKRLGAAALVVALATLALQGATCSRPGGFSSGTSFGGAGISKVTQGSGLAGSGTTSNPLIVGAGSGITTGADDVRVNAGSGLTADATSLRVNAGSGLTFSSGALTTSTSDGLEYASGVLQAHPNNYAGTHLEWISEFMNQSAILNGTNYEGVWSANVNGTGAATSALGTTTRPGLIEFSTGTSATGRVALSTNLEGVNFGNGTWNARWTGGFATLSTSGEEYAYVFGFADISNAVNQVDGCYFLYDRGNVATSGPNAGNADKWSAWCTSNSTRTTVILDGSTQGGITTIDSPVAALTLPDTNIYTLEVAMTGSSSAAFKIDGTTRATITTNIPSGASRMTGVLMLMIKSAGTTARTVDADRTRIAVDLTAARSP